MTHHNLSNSVSRKDEELHERYSTVHSVLQDFANGTSMHGIPRIINARSILGRIFWSGICMGAFSIFIWQCTILLQRYYSYPKKVNMELVQKPVPFPAVTVCNTDFLHMVAANKLSSDLQFDPDEDVSSMPNATEFIHRRKRRSSEHFIDPTDNSTRDFSEFVTKYFHFWELTTKMTFVYQRDIERGEKRRADLFNMYSRLALVANVGPEVAATAGIQLEDFVASCRFMDNKCKAEHSFKKAFDPYYFNCFTFRPESILENTRLQGVEYGLNLLLFSGSAGAITPPENMSEDFAFPGTQETYLALASGRGSRLIIHSPGTRPHPTANGYDIRPGSSVSVGVKARENVRINNPHGNCSSESALIKNAFSYTLGDCQNACIQKAIMEGCGCVDNRIMTDVPNPRNLPFCLKLPNFTQKCPPDMTDECMDKLAASYELTVQCHKEVYENMTIKDPEAMARCECYPPCRDLTYEASYSLSIMPEQSQAHNTFYAEINEFFDKFPEDKKKILIDKYGSLKSPELLQNISRLNVHISDGNIIKTTEAPDYEAIRLVSDIGGQLGLWIGISLMTIFEVIQLGADILRYLTTKGRHLSGRIAHPENNVRNSRNANGQRYIRPSNLDMDSCEIDKLTTV